jgi:hypothetical protein
MLYWQKTMGKEVWQVLDLMEPSGCHVIINWWIKNKSGQVITKVQDIIRADNYCVFTFASTSYALKAEKTLKAVNAEFVLAPTLREISTSCGLSVKFRPENYDYYRQVLDDNRVSIEGAYKICRIGDKNQITKIF